MVNVVAKADAAEVLAKVMGQDYAQAYLGDVGFEAVRADREKIRRARMAEIARACDAHRSSVTRILRDELGSLYQSPVKQKQDVCKRGHDMAVYGKPIKSGGRYCSECKRMRERVGGKNV